MAELHVATDVPGEARVVDVAPCQAAGPIGAVEDEPGIAAELVQAPGGTETGRARAEDHYAARVLHRPNATRSVWRNDLAAARQSFHRTMLLCPVRRVR